MKHQHLANFDVNVIENGKVLFHMKIIIKNVKAVISQYIHFLLKQKIKMMMIKKKMINLMILIDVKNAEN